MLFGLDPFDSDASFFIVVEDVMQMRASCSVWSDWLIGGWIVMFLWVQSQFNTVAHICFTQMFNYF